MRTKRVFVIVTIAVGACVGLLLLVSGVTRSQEGGWAPPINVTNTPGSSYGPRLTVDSLGTVHMVWTDFVDLAKHPPYLLYANKPAGGNWTSYQYLPGKPKAPSVAAAMGPDDTLHIIWFDYDTYVRYIQRHSNGTWSEIEPLGDMGTTPDISVGPDNTVHVVWVGYVPYGPPNVYYSSRPATGGWSSPVILYTGSSIGDTLIATGSDKTVHVIISRTGEGERNLYAYKTNLSGWVTAELPFDSVIWTVEQLAVDSTGTLSLVWGEWHDADSKNHLRYASKSPAGWSEVIDLAVEDYPINAAVAGDSHGNVHVAWKVKNLEQADNVLRYRQKVGPAAWGETLSGSINGAWLTISEDLSVAAGPDNHRYVAWDTGPVYVPYDPNDGRGEIYSTEMQVDPPIATVITPAGGWLVSPGEDVILQFPPGSVVTDTRVILTPGVTRPTLPLFPGLMVDLTATRVSDGAPVTGFNLPYTLTVTYTPTGIGSAIENTLHVYYWNGSQWVAEAGTLDTAANRVLVHPNHMTYFALLGETKLVYLPGVVK